MIERIVDGLYLVHGANKGRFPWSYSILAVGDRAVLFDTGCGIEAIEEVKERFRVDLVVNSHTHPDHFSGNHHFRGYELWAPDMFASILPDLDSMSRRLAGGGEPGREWLHLVREKGRTAHTGCRESIRGIMSGTCLRLRTLPLSGRA